MTQYLLFFITFSFCFSNEEPGTTLHTRRARRFLPQPPVVMSITNPPILRMHSWTQKIFLTKYNPEELERFRRLIQQDEELVDIITQHKIPILYESLHQRADDLTHLLLDWHPNVYFKDRFGRNSLHIATEGSDPNYNVIEHILKITRHATIHCQDESGYVPLEYLIINNDRPDIAKLLVEHGSKITDKAYGLAQDYRRTETLKYFDSIRISRSDREDADGEMDAEMSDDDGFSYDDQSEFLKEHFTNRAQAVDISGYFPYED